MLLFRNRVAIPLLCGVGACCLLLYSGQARSTSQSGSDLQQTNVRSFPVIGVVQERAEDRRTAVIAHEAITNYMRAMTMPFKVTSRSVLAGIQAGDRVSFRLQVTASESWIDHISKIGTAPTAAKDEASVQSPAVEPLKPRHPLLDYHFTNELGQAVSLGEFRGQALAITFFFTRCPIPDFCPRLSKNFEEASQKLRALPNAPTNWHFLSVTFDPDFDSPSVLKGYGNSTGMIPHTGAFSPGR